MCLIVLSWRQHADYPLMLAANRDEYHARPALAAAWWADYPDILAGRDLEGGGTWLGMSRHGRLAALTNYRDPSRHRPGAPSRGLLVRDSLLAGTAVPTTLHHLAAHSGHYVPFNLLLWDGDSLGVFEHSTGRVRILPPGVYGLSNHLLDTPWPKLARLRERFAEHTRNGPDEAAILGELTDRGCYAAELLPDTGIDAQWEHWLSAAFVQAPGYGTRCSTLLSVRRDGEVSFTEWSWDAEGALSGECRHAFSLVR
ncbi:NRDE family protein [Pseudothauera lacus]|uniref:NRDE family protein n=1 Tax=Pseudothauera lacus TaxID=2136175 RepID=A0A2T4IJI9_9RHOO|nr:NRDE family protein [Pseudothauera lacus]PTD97934.1 hypothetical protein C8261_00480 [Pseudothauera lacus]